MKTPILATGLSGLVGTRIKEVLGETYEFTDLSFATGVDITKEEDVAQSFASSDAAIVLHMAAKTDVDGCEDDKIFGEDGAAWTVNVVGTENIVNAAKKTGKHIVYISTDFVFDGSHEEYTEDDEPNPVNWYGVTKHEAEIRVSGSGIPNTIVRIAYPYGLKSVRPDFVTRIREVLSRGETAKVVTDHEFTPTYIDDIALALGKLFERRAEGIFHVVGSQSLTTKEAAETIQRVFSLPGKLEPVTRKEYFRDRAFRPFHLRLKNDRITKLGCSLRSFEEGLRTVKASPE